MLSIRLSDMQLNGWGSFGAAIDGQKAASSEQDGCAQAGYGRHQRYGRPTQTLIYKHKKVYNEAGPFNTLPSCISTKYTVYCIM